MGKGLLFLEVLWFWVVSGGIWGLGCRWGKGYVDRLFVFLRYLEGTKVVFFGSKNYCFRSLEVFS